jgi:hypothetical protein
VRGLTPKNLTLILRADARFFSWETLALPALMFCGVWKETESAAWANPPYVRRT